MELLTLDSNYQPSELVERYASLIWTERYSKSGDFQLVTTDVERMLNLLPLESMVTIRESTVPMLVEVHKIEKSITGAPVLTVTGRTFETVLERRAAIKVPQPWLGLTAREPWIETLKKEADAAYQAIRQTIGDLAQSSLSLPAVSPMMVAEDTFPMIELIPPADYGVTGAEELYEIEIKPGNLYTIIMELLATNHHGLKAVRPILGSNKVGIEIYNGADLTNVVVFDAKFDQFETATYLLSYTASTNMAYVFSKTQGVMISKTDVLSPGSPPVASGLDRRVIFVDISGEEGTDTLEARRTRGLIELYKYNATALFDGQISQQVAAGYNRDYFLGDIIRLDGEYGLSKNVRVAEFIRSDDSTGSKAYPTFETILD